MKIPFKMKTKDCKTVAGYIALYSGSFEKCFEAKKCIKEKEACRESKDSAKEFDKTICNLINKVIKRNKEVEFSKEDYKNISKIAYIYKEFEDSDKSEYDKKYKDMKSDYDNMEKSVNSSEYADGIRAGLQLMSHYLIKLPNSEKKPFFENGNMSLFVNALDPNNLKNNT